MTVKLVFENGIPVSTVDKSLLPPDGGVSVSPSSDSPALNRHDIWTEQSSGVTSIYINGISKSELSMNTEQSIIDVVPTDHIQTREL
jgi:hypothetical protein